MRRFFAVLIVFIATLLLAVGHSGPAAVAAPISTDAVPAHTYDSNAAPVQLSTSLSERGPPTFAFDYPGRSLAADTTSQGASTRPQLVTARSCTTYDHGARSAQVDNGRATTSTPADAGAADLRAPSGAIVAAKAVPETLNFGSRAAAREGLPGDLAAVGNRFFRGATGKSQDFQAVGLPGGGYRLQFFSPADNPGYGKLYVQEIDRGGNIVSRYKDTIGPDGFIERKFVQ